MKVVAFDTETRGLNWTEPDERAFLASWADSRGEYIAVLSDPDDRERFLKALQDADVIVAHNLSFDVHHVREATGLDILTLDAELHDTDLMSRVLFPGGQRRERGGHGLKSLAESFLRADAKEAEQAIKDMGKEIGLRTLNRKGAYYDVWRAFPAVMERYAALDARYTYDLFNIFQQKLEADPDAAKVYELEREVAPVLIRAEQRGICLDPEAVEELYEENIRLQAEAADKLRTELGDCYEGEGSDSALVEALQAQGIPLHRKTPTGEFATHVHALQEFEDDYPIIGTLLDYRRASKFLSTYIEPMRNRETIHPSFMQAEAWTGRMSCRRPNMQNIPKRAGKEVRRMFVARPGHVFVVCDYEGIEVRLLAHYLGKKGQDYRDLIRAGLDPHSYMATQIWGGDMEDYGRDNPKRGMAKNTMFAITYGAGAPRVADMNKISKQQAKGIIKKIKDGLPGYYRLMDRIREAVKLRGYVVTLMGRKQLVNKDKAYVGLNAIIQGSAADVMKRGVVNVASAVEGMGGVPVLFVHDEIVVEVPEQHAAAALDATKSAMVSAAELDPPLEVDGTTCTNYAEA